jgi:hypothetical protein
LNNIIFNQLQKLLCRVLASLLFISLLSVHAADKHIQTEIQNSQKAENKTKKGKTKTDGFTGWELYQNSKSMGTNKVMLCPAGLKLVNPLMSVAYWPKPNQLVLINNSNHKYFICTKEKFPHYVKMLGYDIYGTVSKDMKYSEWKKLDSEPVASMPCVLYQRRAINMPSGVERKEQTWASTEISLPQTAFEVYSQLSGRPDACRFGFPLRSKVITTSLAEGFKVRVDFDTREVATKQFSANDFLVPRDYVHVKEFSEFLLNDSESHTADVEGKPLQNGLHSVIVKLKSKAFADRANEPSAPAIVPK